MHCTARELVGGELAMHLIENAMTKQGLIPDVRPTLFSCADIEAHCRDTLMNMHHSAMHCFGDHLDRLTLAS